MGCCVSSPQTAAQRYRESIDDEREKRRRTNSGEDDLPEGGSPAAEDHDAGDDSSDGRVTTENTFAVAVRIMTTNIKSYVLHGITSDADQYQDEIARQDVVPQLTLGKKKYLWAWIDDHIQATLREFLVGRCMPPGGNLVQLQNISSVGDDWMAIEDCGVHETQTMQTATVGGRRKENSAANSEATSIIVEAPPDEDMLPGAVVDDGGPSNMLASDIPPPLSSITQVQTSPLERPPGSGKEKPLRPQLTVDTGFTANAGVTPLQSNNFLSPTTGGVPTVHVPNHHHGGQHHVGLGSPMLSPMITAEDLSMLEVVRVGPASFHGVIDLALLIQLINEYCGKKSGDKQSFNPVARKVFTNAKGKTVSLGDPIGMLYNSKCRPLDPECVVCPEYMDVSSALRPLDRLDRTLSNASSLMNYSVTGGGSSVVDSVSRYNGSTSNMSNDGLFEDLSDAGNNSFASQLMSPTSTADMTMSPYAAGGNPWKERPLNTETLRVHNRIHQMQEKQPDGPAANDEATPSTPLSKKGKSNDASTREDLIARRPKVMMQLLFGNPILQTYWAQLVRGIPGGAAAIATAASAPPTPLR